MQNSYLFKGVPQKFFGTKVFPLDPDTAKRERFIPLYQLVYWLDKPSSADDARWLYGELLALASHHIRAGHLKAYAPALEHTVKTVSGIEECIWDGEVHEVEVMRISGFEVKEQPHNPLLDIFEFTNWFREINPDHLSLPDNWPAHGVIPSTPSSQQSPTLPRAEPDEPFRFTYERAHSGYTKLCEELASTMHAATGKNANAEQAWAMLLNNPPAGYGASVRMISGKPQIQITGELPISKNEFTRRWKRWTAPKK